MIDEEKIHSLIQRTKKDAKSLTKIEDILAKAKQNAIKPSSEYSQGLSLEDAAILLNVDSEDEKIMNPIYSAALEIKRRIYGNRIVIFAPLYVSNYCASSCLYCGFRVDNDKINRKILSTQELIEEVKSLQMQGHKRLLMLMGDHPKYSVDDFVEHIKIVSSVKNDPHGEIRRINVEIPALKLDEF